MRILELEIINFGKFNHETVTFHDGMNLIYGENEMGKTTLHSFIRGMFFGIEKQRGRADTGTKKKSAEPPQQEYGWLSLFSQKQVKKQKASIA